MPSPFATLFEKEFERIDPPACRFHRLSIRRGELPLGGDDFDPGLVPPVRADPRDRSVSIRHLEFRAVLDGPEVLRKMVFQFGDLHARHGQI